MTTEINYDLLSEILFTNEEVFDCVDINTAKIVSRICKNASKNKNVMLSFDRFKAREYFDKINDILYNAIIYKNKVAYLIRENIGEIDADGYDISSHFDEIIADLKKENVNVLDGFRELVVLEFKEFKYNYENCIGDSFDIRHYLEYCDQYYNIIEYFGYYEYYEGHAYDPEHFMITPESLYDFVSNASIASSVAT
jgi:hypothetical protein